MKKTLISLMIILTSIITIFFEMKSYTPIDKDENEIIENYDIVTKRMEDKIEDRRIKEEKIIQAKNETKKAEEAIKKYGIKTVLNPKNNRQYREAEKIICDFFNYDYVLDKKSNSFQCGIYSVNAIKFDFNDDRIDEIAGYTSSFCGHHGCSAYILEKTKGKYEKLFQTEAYSDVFPIIVLNHKTNGYYDFIISMFNGYKDYKTIVNLGSKVKKRI